MQNKHPNSINSTVLSFVDHKESASTSGKGVSSKRTLSAAPAPAGSGSGSGSGETNSHEVQKPVLKRSSAFSKNECSNPSENNGSAVNSIAYSEVNGLKDRQQSSNLTQKKDVLPNDFTLSGISSNTSRESKKEKDPIPAVPNNTIASSTLLVTPKPSDRVAGSNTSREFNKEKDSTSAAASAARGCPVFTASTVLVALKPSDRAAGLNTKRELNKEKDSASVVEFSGAVRGTSVANDFFIDAAVRGFEDHITWTADSSDV